MLCALRLHNPVPKGDRVMMNFVTMFAGSLALALPVLAATATLNAPIMGGGEFTSGGGVTVAVEAKVINGRPHVCGVWAESRSLAVVTKRKARGIIGKGSLFVGTQALGIDMRSFPQVPAARSYAGAQASCLAVSSPEIATQSLRVRIPRQVVFRGRGKQVGSEVFFVASARKNPAYSESTGLTSSIRTLSSEQEFGRNREGLGQAQVSPESSGVGLESAASGRR